MSSVESSQNQTLAPSTEVSQQTSRVDAVAVDPPKLKFSVTMSRAELRAVPAVRRLQAIQNYIENYQIYGAVYNAAACGKTSYLYVLPTDRRGGRTYPPEYEVTLIDIIEGLQVKFPDCKVDVSEEWVDVRPGVREYRKGIKIDWS